MNDILFMLGDLPIRTGTALIALARWRCCC